MRKLRRQRELMLLQLGELEGVEEVGPRFGVKAALPVAVVEALVDVAQIEA